MIHYMPELSRMIEKGAFDPTDIMTHVLPLDQAEHAHEIFTKKERLR
ncbi:S-(hydroxymethyl)glutathione dehydrogenase / alcohol dehydrogenase [Melghirimyces thermohalophilus]|uniref:S-(Hydroxymethyl)glutathione dehydrogenase / alcohol dehydrogenase n=1 Tax=Melghirimyces thermohalophilus TaxID=1236220 RepID=A0A1G6KSA5_9BACL|nr:S-(hydroxymethyl)glutathione dehydrogenase / alcohol dehydrogenase [Melghirimyces thermohalophilus]